MVINREQTVGRQPEKQKQGDITSWQTPLKVGKPQQIQQQVENSNSFQVLHSKEVNITKK